MQSQDDLSFVNQSPSTRPVRSAKAHAVEQMTQLAFGGTTHYMSPNQSGNIVYAHNNTSGGSGSSYFPTQQSFGLSGDDTQPSTSDVELSEHSTRLQETQSQAGSIPSTTAGRGRKRRVEVGGVELDATQQPVSKRGRGSRGGGRGRGRGRAAQQAAVDLAAANVADDGSLFSIVFAGKVALRVVVDEWIDDYKKSRDSALVALLQFFVHASGCKGRIPNNLITVDYAQLIKKLTEEFDEESSDYPLIMTAPGYKRFRQSFCDFVDVLIQQCQSSIIYDQCMMDAVISLLTGLSDSQVRAFRHTAVLASMKFMSCLVSVAVDLTTKLETAVRQYEAERAKPSSRRANDRIDMLLERRKELEENQDEVKNMLDYMFRSVFVHRYR